MRWRKILLIKRFVKSETCRIFRAQIYIYLKSMNKLLINPLQRIKGLRKLLKMNNYGKR